jgi:flagellar protein FliO/FliZ
MRLITRIQASAALFLASGAAMAADQAMPSPALGLLQVFLALGLVLAVMLAAAWFFKKLGPVAGAGKVPVKVVGGASVGNRERVMVVEVADQWIVIGVTSSQINTLATLPRQELSSEALEPQAAPFAAWLKRTMEQRKNTVE